jgi:WhiB family transcriptional regulator, redox-sensing transcriptional regulator
MSLHDVTAVAEPPDEANWRLRARCRPEDFHVFFAPGKESKSLRTERERAAKNICAACPVIERCRDHALAVNELHGVWGGMSEADRHTSIEIGREMRALSLQFLHRHRQASAAESTDWLNA